MHRYLIWLILGMLFCVQGWAEGNHAPPLEFASPVSLPPSFRSTQKSDKQMEFCKKNPCDQKCSQTVSCDDYDPSRDHCANSTQILMDWKCGEPCSCASDGTIVCSVTYRCVDMKGEMEEFAKFKKPIKIEMDIPLSNYEDPTEEENKE